MEDKTQLTVDDISTTFFALIADAAGTICVEHEDVRAVQNVIRYYLTQNRQGKYVILVNQEDDQKGISKLHIGTYDYERALEVYNIKKKDGWKVSMQTEVEFKINRMHEMAKELEKFSASEIAR